MTTKISVALLTRNGGESVLPLLDALWKQKTAVALEIVAVDSGSTDGTIEALTGRVTTLVRIAPEAFNHGLTRNLAVEHTTGDLIVFVVQDAMPVSDEWLARLAAPLLADSTVAGTFGRQHPRDDASLITRHYLARWIAAGPQGRTAEISGEAEWRQLSPFDRFHRSIFDNVASCIRRSAWSVRPFSETSIAEDVEWARDVMLEGWRIVYTPDAEVVHSHDRSAVYEYRRTYLLHRRLMELFELRTIPTVPLLARAMASSILKHVWWERRSPDRWGRAAMCGVVWPAGQYLGARSAIRGRPAPRWPAGTV